MRRLRLLPPLAVALSAILVGTSLARAGVILNGGTLEISGEFSAGLLAELQRAPWNAVRQVRLTSPGGLPGDSLSVARLLALTGKPIVLHDLCASGCINVLAIRDRVTVAPATLLMFHNTPAGQSALTAAAYPQVSQELRGMGEAQRAWLARNGVRLTWSSWHRRRLFRFASTPLRRLPWSSRS